MCSHALSWEMPSFLTCAVYNSTPLVQTLTIPCHMPYTASSDREPPQFPGTSPHIPFQQSLQLIIVNPAQQQYIQTKQDSISQHQIPSPDLPDYELQGLLERDMRRGSRSEEHTSELK